jgi:hypothetical protein
VRAGARALLQLGALRQANLQRLLERLQPFLARTIEAAQQLLLLVLCNLLAQRFGVLVRKRNLADGGALLLVLFQLLQYAGQRS